MEFSKNGNEMKNEEIPIGFSSIGEKGENNFSSQSDFTLIGYSSLDALGDFINSKYKISEG